MADMRISVDSSIDNLGRDAFAKINRIACQAIHSLLESLIDAVERKDLHAIERLDHEISTEISGLLRSVPKEYESPLLHPYIQSYASCIFASQMKDPSIYKAWMVNARQMLSYNP